MADMSTTDAYLKMGVFIVAGPQSGAATTLVALERGNPTYLLGIYHSAAGNQTTLRSHAANRNFYRRVTNSPVTQQWFRPPLPIRGLVTETSTGISDVELLEYSADFIGAGEHTALIYAYKS